MITHLCPFMAPKSTCKVLCFRFCSKGTGKQPSAVAAAEQSGVQVLVPPDFRALTSAPAPLAQWQRCPAGSGGGSRASPGGQHSSSPAGPPCTPRNVTRGWLQSLGASGSQHGPSLAAGDTAGPSHGAKHHPGTPTQTLLPSELPWPPPGGDCTRLN